MEMLACPNLAVSPQVMQHIVQVESSANPYAIGVVGARLQRQPRNLPEALATVKMLKTRGYDFSLGLAQVNRANLSRYGLDSYRKAFDECANLAAGAHILAGCYAAAKGDWGKAFSCYYSGNFTTGFRDGYVQKVYASINRAAGASTPQTPSHPLPLRSRRSSHRVALPPAPVNLAHLPAVTVTASGPDYRVALRSMAIDRLATATVSGNEYIPSSKPSKLNLPSSSASLPTTGNAPSTRGLRPGVANTQISQNSVATGKTVTSSDPSSDAVFIPQVRGPGDPRDSSQATDSDQALARISTLKASTDGADLREKRGDAAFVF